MKGRISFSIYVVICFIFFNSCKTTSNISKEYKSYFDKYGINGTFVLMDLSKKKYKFFNKNRADSSYIPASTFKILNSLIALETEVISDEKEIIKWDGIDKGWEKWNRDQNMKSAIAVSCVWFYQEIARRIGNTSMQYWIDKTSYGNKIIGGKIDNFWIEGNIRISAKEQVHFLKKLIENKLPFKKINQDIVKQIMVTDSTKEYTLHSKTGWGSRVNPQIGWYVGYIEKTNNTWIFALNIDIKNKSDLKFRKQITYDILQSEGIIVNDE